MHRAQLAATQHGVVSREQLLCLGLRPGRSSSGCGRAGCTSCIAASVTRHDASPVTTPARTLLDLAGMLRPAPLERAVEQSVALELFDLAAMADVLNAHPTNAGAAKLRAIVALPVKSIT